MTTTMCISLVVAVTDDDWFELRGGKFVNAEGDVLMFHRDTGVHPSERQSR